ncbi:hypothetical protein NC653_041719 [Populus alba x Populus x berolinensis]|uniref:Ribosomal protein S16 n=1 Tax=Populus alba x Populus x berolinensis TaxID=444605 RepID=A0AAD6L972_9ROSI|nr:hypothetical protein NC653_041719 [Populus alba x Populus x berolinensis]
MAVKIRLAKLGCLNKAFYRIVAADSHTPRDGKHLRVVGFYDTLADPIQIRSLLKLFLHRYITHFIPSFVSDVGFLLMLRSRVYLSRRRKLARLVLLKVLIKSSGECRESTIHPLICGVVIAVGHQLGGFFGV